MPRVTPQEVQNVLLDNYDSSSGVALAPFINIANVLTNQVAANDTTSILSTSDLKQIELQLAAHFYQAGPDAGYQSRTTSGASGQFRGQTAMVLSSTLYGQTAMLLDASGYLEKRSKEVEEGGRRMVQVYAPSTPENYATVCTPDPTGSGE